MFRSTDFESGKKQNQDKTFTVLLKMTVCIENIQNVGILKKILEYCDKKFVVTLTLIYFTQELFS